MIFYLLFGVLNAAEPESTLTQVVVNGTDETGNSTSACLRAEFTAEVRPKNFDPKKKFSTQNVFRNFF